MVENDRNSYKKGTLGLMEGHQTSFIKIKKMRRSKVAHLCLMRGRKMAPLVEGKGPKAKNKISGL